MQQQDLHNDDPPNLSGKWRVAKTGGSVDAFAKAMGASFILRKAA